MALPHWPGAKTSIGKAYLSVTKQKSWNSSVPMHSNTFRCIQMHSEECWTCGRGGVIAWVPAVDESEHRVKNICYYCYPSPSLQCYWLEAASQSEMDRWNPTNGSPHGLSPRDFESWALGRECGMVGRQPVSWPSLVPTFWYWCSWVISHLPVSMGWTQWPASNEQNMTQIMVCHFWGWVIQRL